jgi:inorganic pyrophosphatase
MADERVLCVIEIPKGSRSKYEHDPQLGGIELDRRMDDEKGRDDMLLCVPISDPQWNEMQSLDDLPGQTRDQIAHFFSIYKQPEGYEVEIHGWFPTEEPLRVLAESRQRDTDQSR